MYGTIVAIPKRAALLGLKKGRSARAKVFFIRKIVYILEKENILIISTLKYIVKTS